MQVDNFREARDYTCDMTENEPQPTPVKGRKAAHPTLTAMARQLQALEFASPLTPDEDAHLRRFMYSPPKNLAVIPRAGQTYLMVRMSFQGKNTTLGQLTGADWNSRAKASRFADMCRAKFWPYKMRDRRPPTAEDLNTSPARVEMDLKNETAMVTLLNEMERFMLGIGIIKLVEIKAANKERKQQTRAELQAINTKLTENNATIKQVLNTLENRLDGLQQLVTGQQKDLSVLIMAVSTILEKLANPPQNTCCIPEGEVRSLSKYES
jgi:hypothetical protein